MLRTRNNQINEQIVLSEAQFLKEKRFSIFRLTFSIAAGGIFGIFLVAVGIQQLLGLSALQNYLNDTKNLEVIAGVFSLISTILFIVAAFKIHKPYTSLSLFWSIVILEVLSYGITLGVLLSLANKFSTQVNITANHIVYAFLGAALIFGVIWGLSSLPSQQQRYRQTNALFMFFLVGIAIVFLASILSVVLQLTVFKAQTLSVLDQFLPGISLVIGGIFSLAAVYFVSLQIRNEQDLVKYYENQDPHLVRQQVWRSSLFYGAWLISSFMNLVFFILRIFARTKF